MNTRTGVVLIEPYGANARPSADYYKKGNIAPPYALESLAGFIKANIGKDVRVSVIHQRAFNKQDFGQGEGAVAVETNDIVDIIREQSKDCERMIVGLRAVTPIFLYALEIVLAIKKAMPKTIVIIGGYYASEVKEAIYQSKTYQKLEQELNNHE
jgi:hypothetical protein